METMQLAAGSRACRRARRFVDRVAGDRLTPEQSFRAMLAVTELTANAMRHAGTDITLEVECLDGCVRISVCDGSPQPPVPRTAARHDVGGQRADARRQGCRRLGVHPRTATASGSGATSRPPGATLRSRPGATEVRVLVVDDDDDVRRAAGDLVASSRDLRIDVVGLAATHVAAVELAEQLQPDVVVTDLVAAFGHTEEDYLAALTLASPDSAVIVLQRAAAQPGRSAARWGEAPT